jgi:hypothetical protein
MSSLGGAMSANVQPSSANRSILISVSARVHSSQPFYRRRRDFNKMRPASRSSSSEAGSANTINDRGWITRTGNLLGDLTTAAALRVNEATVARATSGDQTAP